MNIPSHRTFLDTAKPLSHHLRFARFATANDGEEEAGAPVEGNDEAQTDTEDEGQEPKAEEGSEEAEADKPKVYDEAYVKKLREEAAGYRTRLREAEEKLANAKTPEEFEAAVAEFREENRSLTRKVVAAEFRLPDKLAARLQGETEEELRADAEELARLIAPAPPAPPASEGGGLDGSGDGDDVLPDDPGELAKRLRPTRFI